LGKTLLIAEKPDQARSFYLPLLESVSGEKLEKRHGYFESKSYYLSWFFGHLLEMLSPDEYDEKYKQWILEDLPIIPQAMKYRYKTGARDQGQIITKLCQDSSAIICGTDPDREGQGIFDTFLRYNKINKPTKRLWATSLTEKDLRKAWDKMQGIERYKNLSKARELRSDSDWLVGMNASRAYSIIWKASLPIGRVLTSTLALIVKRDLDVENYKESFFFMLKGNWNGIEFTYFDESGTKFENRGELERVLAVIHGKPFTLSGFQSEEKTENPPKTFNLPDLQKEANVKLEFSLGKTLEIAQSLYEKKITTYPRTDSSYLPISDLNEYYTLVKKASSDAERQYLRTEGSQPACVKDTDSPHTALIVTGEMSSMADDEKKLYEIVRSRFVCAFMVPRTYIQFDLEIDDGTGKKFKATVKQDINSGFRKLYKDEEKEEGVQEADQAIDDLSLRKHAGPLAKPEITQSKKAKPKYYTPATLITAMQTCGRVLENEGARKILAEKKGIGTPATQALYPEQLKKYEYIHEQKGCFISTSKGRKLIREISPDLKTPEMTAEWELKLELVEKGNLSEEAYRKELNNYLHQIINEAKKRTGKIDFAAGDKTSFLCPACKKGIVKKAWGYICEVGCGFSVNSTIAGKSLTDKQIEMLFKNSETALIKGFKSPKTGKTFDAKLVIKEENGKKSVKFEFENLVCPKCGREVRVFEKGAGCTEREKCGFVIWREIGHKKLSDEHLKMLVNKKKTGMIKGFKTKEGKEFEAALVLDKEFKVRFN
jgi:DNA topoisomerase-3